MERKGQGALEYLLLIGGAVLIAVIVITLLLGVGGSSEEQTGVSTASSLCAQAAGLDGSKNCSIEADGTTARVVPIGNDNYDCSGAYPNCVGTLQP
ncbi:MAG TPA: class III signal peptide-containing protein [archaeon]|nr:class III signal peptide-containing protein [archaeon]